jgi:hypothetical protein
LFLGRITSKSSSPETGGVVAVTAFRATKPALSTERRADVYWDSVALRGRRKRIAAVLTAFGYPLRHVNV